MDATINRLINEEIYEGEIRNIVNDLKITTCI